MNETTKDARAARVAAGNCGYCGQPRKSYAWLCDACAARHREKQRKPRTTKAVDHVLHGKFSGDKEEAVRSDEHNQAIQLGCHYRNELMMMIGEDIGARRPNKRQEVESQEWQVAECEIAEVLAMIIERHLVKRKLANAHPRKTMA